MSNFKRKSIYYFIYLSNILISTMAHRNFKYHGNQREKKNVLDFFFLKQSSYQARRLFSKNGSDKGNFYRTYSSASFILFYLELQQMFIFTSLSVKNMFLKTHPALLTSGLFLKIYHIFHFY